MMHGIFCIFYNTAKITLSKLAKHLQHGRSLTQSCGLLEQSLGVLFMNFLQLTRQPSISVWRSRCMHKKTLKKLMNARTTSKFQKYKEKLGKDGGLPVSRTFDLNVICTGSRGYANSVVLRLDHDRYIFNCGETTLKHFSQVLHAVHATENLFFTYNSWSNIGGVIGTMISMNTNIAPKKPVTIHGPPHVDKVLGMCRHFSQSEAMSANVLSTFKCRDIEEGPFQDSQLSVEYVKLVRQSDGQTQSSNRSKSTAEHAAVSSESNTSENQDTDMPEEPCEEKYAIAYIVTPNPGVRNLDPRKLKELKIPRGPWLRDLSIQEPVTLSDGRTIQPEEVLLPDILGKRPFVVLECPSKDFLESLVTSQQFLDLAADPERMPMAIIHMSPVSVVNDLRYQQFMERYSPDVRHIMLNEDCEPSLSPKTLHLQQTLNMLHPTMFPLLANHLRSKTTGLSTKGDVIPATYGLQYVIRPQNGLGIKWDEAFGIEQKSHVELARKTTTDFDEELQKLRENLVKTTHTTDSASDYPEIVFLGTGSAEPSIRRNASGILLQLKKDEYMLLDCGEGTLAQLYQMYGEEVDNILANIKAIFISHLHYDHHGGVFNVAEARFKALRALGRDEDLHLIAPIQYTSWLKVYNNYIKEEGGNMVLHTLQGVCAEVSQGDESERLKQLKALLSMTEINCVQVIHTKHSHALILTHMDGWKLVYSGDTRPCLDLVRYGKDCDILIHEGSFDDMKCDKAVKTNHCTTGEAIDVGEQMQARFTLLTHFSQRVHYIPIFTEKFTSNVGFSFDFMKVKPSQLRQIPLLKPALLRLFGEADAVEEDTPVNTKRKATNEISEKKNEESKKLKVKKMMIKDTQDNSEKIQASDLT